MYQNVCLARFGRLKLLCYDLRSTGRCLQQYSLGQCHLGRRQLAGRDHLHFPLPKIRTIGDELTLSLAKNSHFSFLPSHFPSLPSRRGHHCGADEFTLSIAKKLFALFVPPLSNGTSRATSDRKPKTNDQILPSPILFFPIPASKK